MSVEGMIRDMAADAQEAARGLRRAAPQKGCGPTTHGGRLGERKKDIQRENEKDVALATEIGISSAMIDRLTLTDKVIDEMAAGLLEVAALPDPVGRVTGMWKRPNGLEVGRVRIPLGVIGFIYESRPNVTVDAAGLCLKSGNAVILKGGSEAIHSNLILTEILQQALLETGLPAQAIQVIPTTDREAVTALLAMEEEVDLIIPRGGEGLIRFVAAHSRIPVLKHYKGVCHVYVDEDADLAMALDICFNAKVQRPGVCNAMETLLVHEGIAPRLSPGHGEAVQGRRRGDPGVSEDPLPGAGGRTGG